MTLVLRHWLTAETDAVILNGGTSLRYQRGTVEVVRELLDRELEGFGEIFRYLRYKQVGPDAMLSRAVCGIARGKVVFSMPGSRACHCERRSMYSRGSIWSLRSLVTLSATTWMFVRSIAKSRT